MKNLKEFINEGSWGYEPNENDGALDLRGGIFKDICELIYDTCNKNHYDSKEFETDYAWEALGNIEHFFEQVTKMEGFSLSSKNKSNKEPDKYYYWFRLIDKEHKNIFELYNKLLNQCQNDEKWIENWEDPNKMKKSLEKRKKISEEYDALMKKHIEKQQEAQLAQSTANKQATTVIFDKQ